MITSFSAIPLTGPFLSKTGRSHCTRDLSVVSGARAIVAQVMLELRGMNLSRAGQERAVAFIQTHARPLERALYAYHFGGEPADAVLAELAAFQNEDGGFWRA